MTRAVWDASAVLMVLKSEPGWERLVAELDRAVIGSVNLAEVAGKLIEAGMPADDARRAIESLAFEVIPFNEEHAYLCGSLRPPTRSHGLSLGDRACLAVALAAELPVLTADRRWLDLDVSVEVHAVR